MSPGWIVKVAPDFVSNSSVPESVMTKRGTGSWRHSYEPPERVYWKEIWTAGSGMPTESPRIPSAKSIKPSSNSELRSSPVHMRTQRIIVNLLFWRPGAAAGGKTLSEQRGRHWIRGGEGRE